MNIPEKLVTFGTQDTGRRPAKQINVRENQRGNQDGYYRNVSYVLHLISTLLLLLITVIEVYILSVPNAGYYRNVSCVLNLISTLLLLLITVIEV